LLAAVPVRVGAAQAQQPKPNIMPYRLVINLGASVHQQLSFTRRTNETAIYIGVSLLAISA
jgi:hypothetical protein